jgi:hypothetical protein
MLLANSALIFTRRFVGIKLGEAPSVVEPKSVMGALFRFALAYEDRSVPPSLRFADSIL